jgi:Domain of unknown function (DUF5664)
MSDGWVNHGGDTCPVDGNALVEVLMFDAPGLPLVGVEPALARDWSWGPGVGPEGEGRISMYRVLGGPVGETKPTNPKDAVGIRKAPLSCVPMNVVAEMGLGMLEGAAKYGRHNYRGVGVRTSVYFDAAMRHLISFWEGEDIDPDSGVHHVAKALVTLAVLRDSQLRGNCTDDRPPRSAPFYPDLNARAGDLLDRHAGKSPKHWTVEDDARPVRYEPTK